MAAHLVEIESLRLVRFRLLELLRWLIGIPLGGSPWTWLTNWDISLWFQGVRKREVLWTSLESAMIRNKRRNNSQIDSGSERIIEHWMSWSKGLDIETRVGISFRKESEVGRKIVEVFVHQSRSKLDASNA